MKTAKKVLSIILAVVLVLGTVVVAVNAESSKPIQFYLNAEVLDAEGAEEAWNSGREETVNATNPSKAQTAKETNDVKAYDSQEEHNYADKTKDIYVKPGQVIWVTLGMRTEGDIYPMAQEAVILYTPNVFCSTILNVNTYGVAYKDSFFYEQYDPQFCVGSYSRQTAKNRLKYLCGYDSSLYHCYYYYMDPNFDVLETLEPNIDLQYIGAVPIYVRPDAKEGDKGTIFLNDRFANYVGGLDGGDTSIDTTPYYNDVISLEGCQLNFIVGEEPANLDYKALQDQIDAFDALTEAEYTADSWAQAKDFYDQAVAAKTDATTQKEIDDAAAALEEAIGELEKAPVLVFDALINALAEAAKVDKDTLTTSSAAALDEAVAAAEAAKKATTQEEINKAATDLCDVLDNLETKADLTALNNALAEAAEVDKDKYTADTVKALEDAVAAGQALVAQADDLSDAAAVANAVKDINDAMGKLVLKDADYGRVNDAESVIAGLNEADYTAASWKAVTDAEAAVVRGYDITKQAAVDAMADALEAAIAGLKEVADTSALEDAIAEAAEANKDDYAADVWESIQNDVAMANTYVGAGLAKDDVQGDIDALTAKIIGELGNKLGAADYTAVDTALSNVPADLSGYTDDSVAALNAAINAVVRDLKSDEQSRVDKMAADIEAAINNLEVKKADYTALNTAISNADEKVGAEDLYTADSYAAYKTAYDAAKAVEPNQDYTAQDSINAAADALNAAVEGLVYAGANWEAIDEIVGNINALDRDMYTTESLAALDSAAKTAMDMYNAKADYDVNDQEAIDKAAEDANVAYGKLIKKDADYKAVNDAKAEASALKKANYTTESWAALEAAIAAVVEGKKIDEQEAVNAMAKAINDAIGALELKDANYGDVDSLISRADKLSAKNYTTDSWAALQDAINAVERGLKADKQADVDAMAVAIEKALNGLVPAASADYTEVNKLVDEYNNDVDPSLYTDDSYAAYTAAVKAVDYNLNANEQAKVDAMAKAIKDAKDDLELKDADYTAVEAAKEAFAAVDTDKYTDDSVKAVEDAIAAVVEGKKIDEQEAVNAMAKAINDAIDALELKGADYTAVNEAIAKFEAMDKSAYSSSSVKAVEKAIAAVVDGKTIEEQADVDAMAKAINDAIDGLQAPTGIITDVAYAQSPTNAKDFTVSVEGRPWKVRLINEEGNTITIDRGDISDKITSYDKDGNVVPYLSKGIAYEEWNFSVTLKPGKYTVIGKDIVDDWESTELGYVVDVVNSKVDVNIVSAVADAETVKVGEQLPITVVTGQDIIKLQILVDDATTGTSTFDATSYSTLADGQRTFDVFAKIYRKGDHTLKIRYKTADGWFVCDDIVLNVTANA